MPLSARATHRVQRDDQLAIFRLQSQNWKTHRHFLQFLQFVCQTAKSKTPCQFSSVNQRRAANRHFFIENTQIKVITGRMTGRVSNRVLAVVRVVVPVGVLSVVPNKVPSRVSECLSECLQPEHRRYCVAILAANRCSSALITSRFLFSIVKL